MATSRSKWKVGKFRSGLEEVVSNILLNAAFNAYYEKDILPYVVPLVVKKYTPDFTLTHPTVYLEVKGQFTAQDRKKMKLVIDQHPKLNIVLVFGRSKNTLTKRSKTTYGDWCDKNGVLWCDITEFKKGPKKCLLRILKNK